MIKPNGFLKKFLQKQLSGLTGNIGSAGYPYSVVEWGADDFINDKLEKHCTWWPYEQTGYWLDGYIRLGILLNDESVIANASRIIYNAINKADKDGYIGPAFMKNAGHNYRWAHVVFFRACIALYDYNKDEKIISALTKHYLNSDYDHSLSRDVINVEIMCLLYERTGNYKLIEKAEFCYKRFNEIEPFDWRDEVILSNKKPFVHGVTYNEMMKLPMLLYKHTNNKHYLNVALSAIKKLEKYFMLPGGLINSDEFVESNYYYYCYETCNITDYTWALSYFAKTLNDAKYGDMIEKCVFNAGMGSVTEDFTGLQYMSCANQFILDRSSTHCEFHRGTKQMSYRPNPYTECCAGNVNRFMPNYIQNMWRTECNKIYCDLFGASEYQTVVNGKTVKICEETEFPFGESFSFKVETKTPFKLYIRKPSYYSDYGINADGMKVDFKKGYFVISVRKSVEISINFNSEIVEHYLKGSKSKGILDGIYYSKGLFVYANGQKGAREIDVLEDRQSKECPAYNIVPNKEWGYGAFGNANPVFSQANTATEFDLDKDLPTITIDGAKILNADFVHKKTVTSRWNVDFRARKYSEFIKVKGDFKFTPDLLKTKNVYGNTQKITLYPYGACKIRQTVFPIVKED